jgi:hypothetical protein
MSEVMSGDLRPARAGPVRSPQSLIAGLTLVALAALALWLTSDLDQGTLQSMGPALLPRWLAIAVGLCGLVLVGTGFMTDGEGLDRWSLRGPAFVILAILAFALTIRPFALGAVTLPGLGLAIAGPLAIIIGGYATHEARLRDLLILAFLLTPFCTILFGDLLNLPIPIFPQAFADLFPATWSQKQILRLTAVLFVGGGLLLLLLRPRHHNTSVDVADHSGKI